jgi:cellulose synthase/poly-beta-1,6-N-acetylglucosamine synthase-like glycosyltransferase
MIFRATVIIPFYKDLEALGAILWALQRQTVDDFEVILTEDDDAHDTVIFLSKTVFHNLHLTHITQPDLGFRKAEALNRAVLISRSDYLIFLDADCVPHRSFVERHLSARMPGQVRAGRRAKLGPRFSRLLRYSPGFSRLLENPLSYLCLAPLLHLDGIKGYEAGFRSATLQHFAGNKATGIVGCNFSCWKSDFIDVNGYNEDYVGCGAEDDDLDWRFRMIGVEVKNVKFEAVVYHLFHPARRSNQEENLRLLAATRASTSGRCANGISKYFSGSDISQAAAVDLQ